MHVLTVLVVVATLWVTCLCATNTIDCDLVCTSPHGHDERDAAHCGCDPHSHRHNHTTTVAPVTQSHTTLSMCDYLCSIQMGGAACDCSAPIVPGRK